MSITRNLGRHQVPEVTIKKFGDWEKVDKLLHNFDATVLAGFKAGQYSAAKKLKKAVKRNIRENGGSLGWQPLSYKYQEYKMELGFDPDRILYLTGTYYWNINIWSNGLTYYVGVKKGLRNHFTGGNITVGQIANILEHGSATKNIPARPLWFPTYRQIGGGNRVKALIVWHIRNQIRLQHGVSARITF